MGAWITPSHSPLYRVLCMRKYLRGKKLANLVNCEPFANFLFTNYFQFKSIRWLDFLGLLNYFKCTQKKDKLDTSTLPDPGGPLAGIFLPLLLSQIPMCIISVQQEASSKRRYWGPYISLIPAQNFLLEIEQLKMP